MTTSNISNLPDDVYWAAVPEDQLAQTIRTRALIFRKHLESRGMLNVWRVAELTYYGQDGQGGWANSVAVTFVGDEEERVQLRVNHYRSIHQGLLASGGQERPAFDVRALSSDHEAMQQAPLAKGIIDGYFRTARLETICKETDRSSLILGEGFTALRWNTSLGRVTQWAKRPQYNDDGEPMTEMVERPAEPEMVEVFAVDEDGEEYTKMVPDPDAPDLPPLLVEQPMMEDYPVREGDVDAQTFAPIEVVRDLDAPQHAMTWCILPYRENAWELAAKYPERKRQILAQRLQNRWPKSACDDGEWERPAIGDDSITVWYLYHLPTDAMPRGRHAIVAGDEVLYDDVMPFSEVPVYEMIPEREMRTASGYSPTFDLLCLQAAYDAVFDVMISQHVAVGTQNIIAPKGTDVDASMIARGLGLIEYEPIPNVPGGGKPEPLQLLAISADSYKLEEILKRLMETLSGINSTVRGEPPASLKSGTSLAFISSLATAFNSNFQGARVMHLERVATGLIKILQVFADTKRIAETVGRANRATLKEWSSESISGIQRVAIEIGNPILDNATGKMDLANSMLQSGIIKSPEMMLQIVTTGRLEPVFGGALKAQENLLRENDLLADGKPVTVLSLDDHAIHIREHRGIADSQEVRNNPQLLANVMKHIGEHEQAWATMPQTFAILSGQSIQPPPPLIPPGGGPVGAGTAAPPPEEGAPPPKGPPPTGNGAGVERAKPMGQDIEAPAGGPQMPLMPKNPQTGERMPA
jgi:hypothetical protein